MAVRRLLADGIPESKLRCRFVAACLDLIISAIRRLHGAQRFASLSSLATQPDFDCQNEGFTILSPTPGRLKSSKIKLLDFGILIAPSTGKDVRLQERGLWTERLFASKCSA